AAAVLVIGTLPRIEADDGAVGSFVHHRGAEPEIAAQPLVERRRDAPAHERVDDGGVDAENDQHGADIAERQRDAQAERSPTDVHGSPSRTMKPTPRTV